MPVEDHPKYDDWTNALDALKEANDRVRDAIRQGASSIAAAKRDLRKAQQAYDSISYEIG
jgi:uncharacterized protein YukE